SSMTQPSPIVPTTDTMAQMTSSLRLPRRSPLRSADASSADSANDSRRSSNAVSSPHRSVICRFSDSSAPAGIPISIIVGLVVDDLGQVECADDVEAQAVADLACRKADRKSTRLNSSHVSISYAVFCLKKKKKQ